MLINVECTPTQLSCVKNIIKIELTKKKKK